MSDLKLNRAQLAQFISNPQTLRAFEKLLEDVKDNLPTATDDSQTTADTALVQTAEALAGLAQVANDLSSLLLSAVAIPQMVDVDVPVVQLDPPPDFYIPPVDLGTMASQNAAKVAITGGLMDGVDVGQTTPGKGTFTTLTQKNAAALVVTQAALNNGAGAAVGTLANAPAAGNPTKWIPINDNGTTRYVPAW